MPQLPSIPDLSANPLLQSIKERSITHPMPSVVVESKPMALSTPVIPNLMPERLGAAYKE